MSEIAPMQSSGSSAGRPGAGSSPGVQGQRAGGAATPVRRQFVSFAFYKLMPEFRRLPQEQQRGMLAEFAELVEKNDRQKMILLTYSCLGTRPDVDLMFWKIGFDLDDLQNFTAAINR